MKTVPGGNHWSPSNLALKGIDTEIGRAGDENRTRVLSLGS